MFKLILENKYGNSLEFTQRNGFAISEVQGLNPPDATINTSEVALLDGAKFNSSKVNMRVINIAFSIEFDAAAKRRELYKVVKTKEPLKMYFDDGHRNVYIEGYVQAFNVDHFAPKQNGTISILCTSPYFKDAQMIINELSSIVKNVTFPFSTPEPVAFSYIDPLTSIEIVNNGDVDTGLIFELYARGRVVKPKIFDYLTGEYIGINYTFTAGDLITIDTRKGQKVITLLRNGETSNKFNTLMQGSKWLQLSANGGVYTVDADSGLNDLTVSVVHHDLYEGV